MSLKIMRRGFSCLFLLFLLFSSLHAENGLEKRLQEHIVIKEQGPHLIGYLTLGREHAIDKSTHIYVKFALDHFKEKGVSFVVLHLNTPGGEVFSALEISKLLLNLDSRDHIPVVAFIDNWALSAGAMLAYSCRYIGIVNTASMGAAEPVMQGSSGEMESASEKINSALRAEFFNLAKYYGRDPLIAEAMVDKDILLVKRKGTILRLSDEKEVLKSDEIISQKGKLLTLTSEQLTDLGIADFIVPAVASFTEGATEWSFSESPLASVPFFAKIPDAKFIGYNDWRIDFFAFLAHPAIASMLFIGLMIGIYGEISNPGFGFSALLALLCLGLILLSHFAMQAIHWLELIIFISGIVLLCIELFVMPTFGLLGIISIVMAIGGLFALLLPSFDNFHFTLDSQAVNLATMAVLNQLAWLSGAFLVSLVLIALLAKYFTPKFPLIRRLVLLGEQNASEGFVAGPTLDALPGLGKKGIAITPLRPSGKVEIEGKRYDAMTEGGFVEKDTAVEVLRIDGGRIIIRGKKD